MKYILFAFLACASFLIISCAKDGLGASNATSNSSGNSTGGSLARFTLVGNYLYTINNQNLKTYNVSTPASPALESTITVGGDIETIFPYKDKLFIGSSRVMYVYSISNPAKPQKTSQVAYVVIGCDPVVANDSLAYSTVRNLRGNGSTLNVIDIKNVQAATIVNRISFATNMYGLGLADTALYVCEHSAGLKIYSLKNSATIPTLRKALNNGETYYDVIPSGNLLYTWIEGGNSILNITDRMNPVLLSKTKN